MKNKLIELLEKGYQAEKDFIVGLTDAERDADSTLEKWTAKDIIAHNSHWRKHHAENLLAALAGKTPSRNEDIDHANEDSLQPIQGSILGRDRSAGRDQLRAHERSAERVGR